MIKILITTNGKKVKTEAEFDIAGTRGNAKAQFVSAMDALKQADKDLFRDALHVIVNEDIHEMIDELDELEDGGELDD